MAYASEIAFPVHATAGSCIANTFRENFLKFIQELPRLSSVSVTYVPFQIPMATNSAINTATLIASQWKNEPAHQKDYWRYLAEQEERNHKKKYPDYKYRVRKPQGKKRKEQHAAATIAGEIN